MKSADEIKKGMECCGHPYGCQTDDCPYYGDGCYPKLHEDNNAYIQSLENKLKQALEDIRMIGRMGANICPVCAHYNHGEGDKQKCVTCIINRDTDNFEWRGAKE